MKQIIHFFESPYYLFSNWSAHAVVYNNVLYMTAEHAYHTQKFMDTAIQKEIQLAISPFLAKETAQKHKEYIRKDWDSMKVAIMQEILHAKVAQHADVKATLLASGDAEIIEDSPLDMFWGIGKDGNGKNMLGLCWMDIRKELQTA